MQSDQDLHCPLTDSMDTTECINGELRLGRYFIHVQKRYEISASKMPFYGNTYIYDITK